MAEQPSDYQRLVGEKQISLRLAELKLTPEERGSLVTGSGYFSIQNGEMVARGTRTANPRGLECLAVYQSAGDMVIDITASLHTLEDRIVHVELVGAQSTIPYDFAVGKEVGVRGGRDRDTFYDIIEHPYSKSVEKLGTGVCSVIGYIRSEVNYNHLDFSSDDKKVGVDLRVDSEVLKTVSADQQQLLKELTGLFGSSIEGILGNPSLSDADRAKAIERITDSLRNVNLQSEETK